MQVLKDAKQEIPQFLLEEASQSMGYDGQLEKEEQVPGQNFCIVYHRSLLKNRVVLDTLYERQP